MTICTLASRACLALATCFAPTALADAPQATHKLAVRGAQFTLDGEPVFLLGCSYYGALGAEPAAWKADLDDMQKAGMNWIRVWATWSAFDRDVSAVDGATGEPRQPYMEKLEALVGECDRRGMVVDVTLSRGNGGAGPSRLQGLATHRRAVESLIAALKTRRNWYLDLSNERNIQDKRFTSFDDLTQLRARVRQLDLERLVTASHGGDPSDDELRKYVQAGVDFLSPHRPRHAESPAQTEATTRRWLTKLAQAGRVLPIHFQEPFRRGYGGYSPQVRDFQTDLSGALAGGAAGWCFHNGDTRGVPSSQPRRSFDLTSKRLFDQLDDVEREAVDSLQKLAAAGIPNPAKQRDGP